MLNGSGGHNNFNNNNFNNNNNNNNMRSSRFLFCTCICSLLVALQQFRILGRLGTSTTSTATSPPSPFSSTSSLPPRGGQGGQPVFSGNATTTITAVDDDGATYRILCTTDRSKLGYGSYKIRCHDLAAWAERCTPHNAVRITTGVAIRDLAMGLEEANGKKKGGRKKGDNAPKTATTAPTTTAVTTSNGVQDRKFHAIISVKTVPSPASAVDALLLPYDAGGGGGANSNKNNTDKTKKKRRNVYIDLVDNYDLKQDKIPIEYTVIFQIDKQKELFPKHRAQNSYGVVEHWYNSYPQDMVLHPDGDGGPPQGYTVPDIASDLSQEGPSTASAADAGRPRRSRPLRMATIWNTLRSADEGGCPALPEEEKRGQQTSSNADRTGEHDGTTADAANAANAVPAVTYDCIEQEFDIVDWYLQADQSPTAKDEMDAILADPALGRGRLYYNLFSRYDVLVALAKNYEPKLRYGNVQRIVSQMRSGVPVLVEVRGHVLDDFMDRYNYTCAFRRVFDDGPEADGSDASSRLPPQHWTFAEAVRHLKDANVRKECQRQGMEIVKDYSPSKIAQKFLRIVGYTGDFVC